MRNSLLTFLQSTPHVKVVASLDDPTDAPEAVHQYQPDTLVMDADFPEPVMLSVIQQLCTTEPAMNRVVLVSNIRQQRRFLEAGATHVLLKGCLDKRLQTAVRRVESLRS
jgi:DNA-binding NarL/FixJ family response regulator